MSLNDQAIIEEFRQNDGKVRGWSNIAPILLLHTTGARTGAERVSPLVSMPLENGWAVFASKGGADENPAWFHNVLAHPEVTIEIGTDEVPVRAREAKGDEYDRIWSRQKAMMPNFAEYERRTKRERIPVIVLEPAT